VASNQRDGKGGRRVTRFGAALVTAAGALIVALPAFAHRLSPAYFGLTETEPDRFNAEWKVSIPGGLADVLEPKVPDGCSVLGNVRSYVVGDARLLHARLECPGGLAGRQFLVDGLSATATDVLFRIDYLNGASYTHRLVPDAPSVLIPSEPGTLDVAVTYLRLGIEHILLGIDHLLFVFALLLFVEGFSRLVATITSFTVAHSITLGAAALGFVNVPSAPVEAAIALSILFVATELAREPIGERRAPRDKDLAARFPWLVAFSFGLLHGFGFAGALSEIGLPENAIPIALLFFNVGVELGQLGFVAVVLAAAWLAARFALPMPLLMRRLAAYVIGSVSALWVLERSFSVI
jgi:hypothetical protein